MLSFECKCVIIFLPHVSGKELFNTKGEIHMKRKIISLALALLMLLSLMPVAAMADAAAPAPQTTGIVEVYTNFLRSFLDMTQNLFKLIFTQIRFEQSRDLKLISIIFDGIAKILGGEKEDPVVDQTWYSDAEGHWQLTEGGSKANAAAHTWDEGAVTKAASCSEKGEMTFTCTVCGQTKTEDIPATAKEIPASSIVINSSGEFKGVGEGFEGNALDLSETEITSVEECALGCVSGVDLVKLPGTVNYIGGEAFDGMADLKEFYIGEGEGTVEFGTVPDHCSGILDFNPNLEKVVINKNVIATADGMFGTGNPLFYGCTKLGEITINGSFTFNGVCFVDVGEDVEGGAGAVVTFNGDVIKQGNYELLYCAIVKEVHFNSKNISGNLFYNGVDATMPTGTLIDKIVFDSIPDTILTDSFIGSLSNRPGNAPTVNAIVVPDLDAWREAGQPATISGITVTEIAK